MNQLKTIISMIKIYPGDTILLLINRKGGVKMYLPQAPLKSSACYQFRSESE